MLRCAFLNVFTFGSLQRQRHSGTAAVRLSRSVQQIPEERAGRAELRMRLLVSLGQGSESPYRVCFTSPGLCSGGGDGCLAARCSCWWAGESARAASGEATVRSRCESPHTRRSRVASAKGIWGRGYPEAAGHGEAPRPALKVVSGRDYPMTVRVWVARNVQYQVELE